MKLENFPQGETPGDIMVVDDKLENLRTIEALLKEQGYKVRCITDAKTALEVVVNKPPEIMLLDVLMPGMNGYELCRALKARPETGGFPIIFLTALTEMENLVEGFQAGGVGFLSKPFRPEEVLAHVKTHVELYRARKTIQEHKELLEKRVAEQTADLQEANRQLRESEEKYKTLFDNALVALFRVNLEGKAIVANKVTADLFGYSSVEEFIKEFKSVNHYADINDRELILKELKEKGFIDQIEMHSKKKDGTVIWNKAFFKLNVEAGYVDCEAIDITERKQAEDALRKSEATARALLNAPVDIVLLLDPAGIVLDCNETAILSFSLSREELIGSCIWDLITPELTEQRKKNVERVIQSGVSVRFEDEREDIWFDNVLYPVFDEQQKVRGVAIIARNITDRKQAEETIRDSESKLRALFENAQYAIGISYQGTHIMVNPAYLKIFGYKNNDELMNKPIIELIAPDSRKKIMEYVKLRAEGKSVSTTYETRGLRKDGTEFDLDVRISTYVIDGINYSVGFMMDITKRKKVEESLKESSEQLEIMFSSPQFLIAYLNRDLNFIRVNKAYADAGGYEPDFYVGKNHFDMYPNEENESIFRSIIDTGEPYTAYEKPFEYPDQPELGTTYWNWTIFPVKDSSNKVSGLILSMVDVTERVLSRKEKESLETQLRQAQKMEAIGTLAGGIAHDFNNILHVIYANTDMALDSIVPDNEMLQEFLTSIQKASHRASDLVKQILTFSRKTKSEKKPLQLSLLVKKSLKLLRSSIPTTITIKREIASSASGKVFADTTQIHQVIMNLCVNAAFAMRENGGTLTVSLSRETVDSETRINNEMLLPGEYMKLSISDTGEGIPAEDQDKIFEPYFTSKPQGKGTGLGLAVVHGIVKDHAGVITVESEYGKGSTFTFILPIYEAESVDDGSTTSKAERGSGCILFVDDELK